MKKLIKTFGYTKQALSYDTKTDCLTLVTACFGVVAVLIVTLI